MADKPLRASLNVDSIFHLGQNDGWEFLSYDTTPAGTGFLIRDAQQDPNKHRLEILYWQQDREQDDTQFVLEAETGNIGVISSAPGFLLNAAGESSKPAGTLAYPVALCGRVPCKVTDENGPIQRGDLLTSASIPGHAMKAVPVNLSGIAIHRPGTIIGKALEALPAGKGVIEVFVGLK